MRSISCLFWKSGQKFWYETEKILGKLRTEQTDETTLTRTNRTKSITLQEVSMELVINWQGHESAADSLEHNKLRLCFKQNSKIIKNTEVCHTRSTMKPSSVDSNWTKYEPCSSKSRLFGRISNWFTYLFLFVFAEQSGNHSGY